MPTDNKYDCVLWWSIGSVDMPLGADKSTDGGVTIVSVFELVVMLLVCIIII